MLKCCFLDFAVKGFYCRPVFPPIPTENLLRNVKLGNLGETLGKRGRRKRFSFCQTAGFHRGYVWANLTSYPLSMGLCSEAKI